MRRKDPVDWSEKMNLILSNQEFSKSLGENGRKVALKDFNIQTFNKNFNLVYKKSFTSLKKKKEKDPFFSVVIPCFERPEDSRIKLKSINSENQNLI